MRNIIINFIVRRFYFFIAYCTLSFKVIRNQIFFFTTNKDLSWFFCIVMLRLFQQDKILYLFIYLSKIKHIYYCIFSIFIFWYDNFYNIPLLIIFQVLALLEFFVFSLLYIFFRFHLYVFLCYLFCKFSAYHKFHL